jgi:hypothetical protein
MTKKADLMMKRRKEYDLFAAELRCLFLGNLKLQKQERWLELRQPQTPSRNIEATKVNKVSLAALVDNCEFINV